MNSKVKPEGHSSPPSTNFLEQFFNQDFYSSHNQNSNNKKMDRLTTNQFSQWDSESNSRYSIPQNVGLGSRRHDFQKELNQLKAENNSLVMREDLQQEISMNNFFKKSEPFEIKNYPEQRDIKESGLWNQNRSLKNELYEAKKLISEQQNKILELNCKINSLNQTNKNLDNSYTKLKYDFSTLQHQNLSLKKQLNKKVNS